MEQRREWMKPAVPETRRALVSRVILLARVPTTLSIAYTHTEGLPPIGRAGRSLTLGCEGAENPALIAAGEVDW